MTREHMQDFINTYNAAEELKSKDYLTKGEYARITKHLLRTIIARFAFELQKKGKDEEMEGNK